MSNARHTLHDLIQIANDGATFYDAAAKEVKNPPLVELFHRMGAHKRDIGNALAGQLELAGETAPTSGTIVGALRKTYADLRASLSSHDDEVYVSQLEQSEDRLLEHFQQALKDCDDSAIHSQIQALMPRVRACHEEMSNWKQRMSNAA